MESEVVSHCVGPLTREYLSKCLHHIAPCTNLHRVPPSDNFSKDCSSNIFKSFPYSSTMPAPLTPLTKLCREVINGIDPTTVLIREKIKWQRKKEKIVKAVQKDKQNIRKKVIEKALKGSVGGEAMVPQGVVLLAQHLDTDPDPCFSGVCNWYYTGGTLAKLKQEDNHFLLHAEQSDLNCSRIVEGDQSELSSTVHLEDHEPIFQIVTNANGAAVRQKSSVSFLSLRDSEGSKLQLAKIHSVFDKKETFVSVAMPAGFLRTFCTISNTRVLKLWDIEYSKKYKLKIRVEPGDGVSVRDNWSTMQYLDHRTLLLADRCCLHVLDVRAGMREKRLAWCSRKLTELCEEQCNLLLSSVSDRNVYTATTHQLLCLDLRQGYSQRWTHMMASSPHLGFTHRMDDDEEVVCLGSQVMSDCVAVVNTWKGSEGQSLYKPTSLPSPAQGLHLARRHGECLDPSLTQRVTQSMTGLTLLPADDGIHVVRQSATADVFVQELSTSRKANKQLTERELMAFSQWSKPTLELPPDPTASTSVTCVYNFQSFFKGGNAGVQKQEPKEVEEECTTFSYCQMSKQYMEDCVDLLAGKLLDVWQVEEEDEWAPEPEVEESFTEQDPEEKVINWLHAADTSGERMMPSTSTILPSVTSTPFPLKTDRETSPNPSQGESEPSPWMTQLSQVSRPTPTQLPERQRDSYVPCDILLSPAHSLCSSFGQRKKLKPFEDTIATTSSKAPIIAKKPDSVPKKKFIPGF